MKTELGNVDTMEEETDIVAGYLVNPHILTDDVGKNFEVSLINVLDHAVPGNRFVKMMDHYEVIKKRSIKEYINELAVKRLDPYGRVLPKPKNVESVSQEETAVYIACQMGEHFADDVLSAAEDIEDAKKVISNLTGSVFPEDVKNRDDAEKKVSEKRLFKDVLQYASDWVIDDGRVDKSRERLTGSDATNYVPLDVESRHDLIRANVGPRNIITMFACDCRKFIPKTGWSAPKQGERNITSGAKNKFGLELIALSLKLPKESTADEINEYIRTQLATDTRRAKLERLQAIAYVKRYTVSRETSEVANSVLRHTFQYKNNEDYSRIPGIAGAGDEIRYRN